jgi:hypothetical protein
MEPSNQFQARTKTLTVAISVITLSTLLLYDWDKSTGYRNVFSGIRPAVKAAFNRIYGVKPRE